MLANHLSGPLTAAVLAYALLGCSQTGAPHFAPEAQLDVSEPSKEAHRAESKPPVNAEAGLNSVAQRADGALRGSAACAALFLVFGCPAAISAVAINKAMEPALRVVREDAAATIRENGGSEDDARGFLEEAPRDLTERDEVLAVYRGGIFVFMTRNNTRPHKDILQAWEAEWNSPRRWGLFGSKLWEGAEVIVIRKLPNSELMAFRSSAYYGKEEPASENAIRAAKVHFRAVSPSEEVIREPIATNKTRIYFQDYKAPDIGVKRSRLLGAKETLARGFRYFRFEDWRVHPTEINAPESPDKSYVGFVVVMYREGEVSERNLVYDALSPAYDARQILSSTSWK